MQIKKAVPVSIEVSYAAKTNKNVGTASNSYFTDRGSTTSYYKVLSSDTINDGDRLLVGYIKPDNTGIDGTITIKAYLDADKVAISDTFDGEESDNMGTTNTWVNNRVVLTTTEWNSLQANGVSFQVKVEANEGIWVKEQIKYNANGGTVSPSFKEIDNDAIVYGNLPTPTRGGYTFDGWFTDPVNGTEVTASTSYTQGTSVTTLYAHWLAPICVRATTLHTETCNNINGNTRYNYCYSDGYYLGGTMDTTTITYGNLGIKGNTPVVGDAFDCDVNGDGNYTERFYYVSQYYNTGTKTFDDITGYATLIYYSNTVGGIVSEGGSAYNSGNENYHGPVVAKTNLPTNSQWSNITLKDIGRKILACSDQNCSTTAGTTTSGINTIEPFSYSGYAARLLTLKELKKAGCETLNGKTSLSDTGSLTACNFLFEGTRYADISKVSYGPWLENPDTASIGFSWSVYSYNRNVNSSPISESNFGARPAIDVPYSRIDY